MSQSGSLSNGRKLFQNALQVIRGPEVDMTTTGTTDFYTFPADFVVCGIKYIITSLTGVAAGDTEVNIGFNAPSYNNIIQEETGLPQFLDTVSSQIIFNGANPFTILLGGELVKVNISVAESAASVMTMRVDMIGYYYTGPSSSGGGSSSLTITGDSGIPAQTVAGNWDIIGGTGVNTVSSAGQLIINAPATGVTWTDVTGTTQAMSENAGYTANNAGLVTLTLPGTASYGTTIDVVGKGAGLFTIAQNANQIIHMGSVSSSTGIAGSFTATTRYCTIKILCTVANLEWTVIASEGNFTIV